MTGENRREVPPSQGEKRAVVGYSGQYVVLANITIQHLTGHRLEAIRLVDPEAGWLDDFQALTSGRLDAYQVKWSQYPRTMAWGALLNPGDAAPPLLRQIADGWARLRGQNPGLRVVAHLLTNDIPSAASQRRPIRPRGIKPPASMATFIEQEWNRVRESPVDPQSAIGPDWTETWDLFRLVSGLDSQNFWSFVQNCHFDLNYRLPSIESLDPQEQRLAEDVRVLASALFHTVATSNGVVKLDSRQVLSLVGWESRAHYKSRHEFPVDETLYSPIATTIAALEASIESTDGGYLALIGTPGSGKSTLLAQELRTRHDVISYYVYVPESSDPLSARAEAMNFLHDITLSLDDRRIMVGRTLNHADIRDISELQARLMAQLGLVNEKWKTTGIKTVIIVDGLDHISRELHPDRSLINVLPQPEEVPDGVLFLLGTQTVAPLPARIRHVLGEGNRSVEMQGLSRTSVLEIVNRSRLSITNQTQRERIFELSAGHPLALAYIVQRLNEADGSAEVDQLLAREEPFHGNIEASYKSYWETIQSEPHAAVLLGRLARLRRPIETDWVKTWAEPTAYEGLRGFRHYFRREGGRWYIFHNSFRLFVINQTAQSLDDQFDRDADRDIHRGLAQLCAAAPSNSPYRFDELFHRLQAQDYREALQLASQDWFRAQLQQLRPPKSIAEDIQLTIRLALRSEQDALAFTRLILIGAEMTERADYLGDSDLASLIARVGREDQSAEYARFGARLLVTSREALALSRDLSHRGHSQDARQIFELAEPLSLLEGYESPQRWSTDDYKLLDEWATIVPLFRTLPDILERVSGFASRVRDRHSDPVTADAITNRLLFRVAETLISIGHSDDLPTVIGALTHDDGQLAVWINLHAARFHTPTEPEVARRFLDHAVEGFSVETASAYQKVVIAESALRIGKDIASARSLIANVQQPDLATYDMNNSGMQPFQLRFRLNRLLAALGEPVSPSAAVPDQADVSKQALTYFERAIVAVAQVWGAAWRQDLRDPHTLLRELLPAIRLARNPVDHSSMSTGLLISGACQQLLVQIVRAAAQHGREGLTAIRDAFLREWDSEDTAHLWPPNLRREVLVAFANVDAEPAWIQARLREIERPTVSGRIYDRVSECVAQAEAWLALEQPEEAQRLVDRCLHASFGIAPEKDYQLDVWIEWLERVNREDVDRAVERSSWLAARLVGVQETMDNGAAKSAAAALIGATFKWSPRRAVRLFQWFEDAMVLTHADALESCVRAAVASSDGALPLALSCLSNLVIPCASTPKPSLIEDMLGQLSSTTNLESAVRAAQMLSEQIEIWAPPTLRREWQRGIAEWAHDQGLELEWLPGKPPADEELNTENSSLKLELRTGKSLRYNELLAHVPTATALVDLARQATEGSYFDWEPLVLGVLSGADSSDIEKLRHYFTHDQPDGRVLAAISGRLIALNQRAEAWRVATDALEFSGEYGRYGWDPRWDGGRRLAASRALVVADPERGQALVFDTLVNDLSGESWSPQQFALTLKETLPLVAPDMPVLHVWAEIQRYLASLLSDIPEDNSVLDVLSDAPPNDTAEQALADLALWHAVHPISLFAEAGLRLLRACLLDRIPAVRQLVEETLASNDPMSQERAVMALHSATESDASAALPFSEVLTRVVAPRHHSIRNMLQSIAARIGVAIQPAHRIGLPSAYSLVLPPRLGRLTVDRREASATGPLPDSDEPAELVRAFQPQLEAVAEQAGLEPVNVFHRAHQLMAEIPPAGSWWRMDETSLRSVLEAADLRLGFTRPRAAQAQMAVAYVVAELVDAGLLGTQQLATLERLLRDHDPLAMAFKPISRPAWIPSLDLPEAYGPVERDWVNGTDTLGALPRNTAEGSWILAEITKLTRLDTGRPTEERRSWVTHGGVADQSWMQPTVANMLISEYFDQPYAWPQYSSRLIIRNEAHWHGFSFDNWLALNPFYGFACGWTPCQVGLMRWLGPSGEIMVETIRWQDGVVRGNRITRDEVGQGWQVIASSAALEQLIATVQHVKRELVVERSLSQSPGDKCSHRTIRSEPIG
jgi:hypothetical protein